MTTVCKQAITPKSVDDWPISKKAKFIVKQELEEWKMLFAKKAAGRTGNVTYFDVTGGKYDIFYFTDCRDILSETKESKAVEDDLTIRRRKRAVFCQLLVKQIIEGPTKKVLKCTHCGSTNRFVAGLPDMSGHFYYCEDCGKTDVCIYPGTYNTAISGIVEVLQDKGILKKDPNVAIGMGSMHKTTTGSDSVALGEKVCPNCGKMTPCSEFYKYESAGNSLTYWCKDCIDYYTKTKSIGAN